jgi:hypothetical protein
VAIVFSSGVNAWDAQIDFIESSGPPGGCIRAAPPGPAGARPRGYWPDPAQTPFIKLSAGNSGPVVRGFFYCRVSRKRPSLLYRNAPPGRSIDCAGVLPENFPGITDYMSSA